ncbi:MAG TPA: PAS domain-containing protein [Bradyrhizobium sp.]|nr:PAS domain-containing protein [Bradyrhizobium sp.]
MKHPSSRAFFAYWDRVRGEARAPDRSDFEPGEVRPLLGDIFVLSCEANAGHRFRVAGTRVCALLGRDLKDQDFSALFAPACRAEIDEIVAAVAEETLPAIAGLTATSQDGGRTHLELLLLPFHTRAHAPVSLTGLLAPFESSCGLAGDLTLTSWRYLHPQQKIVPRLVRKLALARGLMVYEGLR